MKKKCQEQEEDKERGRRRVRDLPDKSEENQDMRKRRSQSISRWKGWTRVSTVEEKLGSG